MGKCLHINDNIIDREIKIPVGIKVVKIRCIYLDKGFKLKGDVKELYISCIDIYDNLEFEDSLDKLYIDCDYNINKEIKLPVGVKVVKIKCESMDKGFKLIGGVNELYISCTDIYDNLEFEDSLDELYIECEGINKEIKLPVGVKIVRINCGFMDKGFKLIGGVNKLYISCTYIYDNLEFEDSLDELNIECDYYYTINREIKLPVGVKIVRINCGIMDKDFKLIGVVNELHISCSELNNDLEFEDGLEILGIYCESHIYKQINLPLSLKKLIVNEYYMNKYSKELIESWLPFGCVLCICEVY